MIELPETFLNTLHKGDTIPARVIRQASGIHPGSEEYRLAQLQIRAIVEKWFHDQGVTVTTRARRHDVVVLTDAEASVCCGDRNRHALRKMGRAKRGLEGVDTLKLTDEEKGEHDVRMQRVQFMYTAARKASRRAAMMADLASPKEKAEKK